MGGGSHILAARTSHPLNPQPNSSHLQVAIEDQPGIMFFKNYDSRKEIGLVGLRNQVRASSAQKAPSFLPFHPSVHAHT